VPSHAGNMYLLTQLYLLSNFAFTIINSSSNELSRRASLIIVEESERVNNVTDSFAARIDPLRGPPQNINVALEAFYEESDNLVLRIHQSADTIRKGEKVVTERDADKVLSLRQSHKTKVLTITNELLKLGDVFKANDRAQFVVPRLEQQKTANKAFARVVTQKMLARDKDVLTQWDEESQLSYEVAIRSFRAMAARPDSNVTPIIINLPPGLNPYALAPPLSPTPVPTPTQQVKEPSSVPGILPPKLESAKPQPSTTKEPNLSPAETPYYTKCKDFKIPYEDVLDCWDSLRGARFQSCGAYPTAQWCNIGAAKVSGTTLHGGDANSTCLDVSSGLWEIMLRCREVDPESQGTVWFTGGMDLKSPMIWR
jgi:hypothetical protein